MRPELVVLDRFMGIEHSAVAAKECGVGKFIGFDIDRDYVRLTETELVAKLVEEMMREQSNSGPVGFGVRYIVGTFAIQAGKSY